MSGVEVGRPAPDFHLLGDDGKSYSLADFAGRKLILYFYPKDDTPGCTREAQGFRDSLPSFRSLGAQVVGVSKDGVDSHKKFKEKHSLPFLLLSDPEAGTLGAYGVWKEKTLYGKKTMGVVRSTVVIDEQGVVRRVFENVKADGHPQEVLDTL